MKKINKVFKIGISKNKGEKIKETNKIEVLSGKGIIGDRYFHENNNLLAKLREENKKQKKENYIFLALICGVVAVTGIIASL